jgi:hypothetical protein
VRFANSESEEKAGVMEIKIFVGLEINPTDGEWFTVTDSDDVDSAFEAIQARADKNPHSGGEIGVMDFESPIPLDRKTCKEIGDIVDWLCGDGSHCAEGLIRVAYSNDSENYQSICEEARGPFKNEQEWAADMYTDTLDECDTLPEILKSNIDWEGVARWLQCEGWIEIKAGIEECYYYC